MGVHATAPARLGPPPAQVPRSHVDDEYAHAGEVDPKVLITTSRNPSSRLVQFAKVRPPRRKQRQRQPRLPLSQSSGRGPCFSFLSSQEMKLVVPNSQRINRGGQVLSELVETCRSHDFTDIVVLHEHRGEPGEGRGVGGAWSSLLLRRPPSCAVAGGAAGQTRASVRGVLVMGLTARKGACGGVARWARWSWVRWGRHGGWH